jgi:hypothetical protein
VLAPAIYLGKTAILFCFTKNFLQWSLIPWMIILYYWPK